MRGTDSKSALVRVFALLVSLALVAVACGGSDDDDGGTTAAPTTAAADGSDDGADAPATTIEALTSEGEGVAADEAGADEPQFGGEIEWALSNDGTGFDTTSDHLADVEGSHVDLTGPSQRGTRPRCMPMPLQVRRIQ